MIILLLITYTIISSINCLCTIINNYFNIINISRGKWGKVKRNFSSVSQGVQLCILEIWLFLYVLSLFLELIRLKKLIYILLLNKYLYV